MADAYQFDGAEPLDQAELQAVVKKLKSPPKGKDGLVKLLKVRPRESAARCLGDRGGAADRTSCRRSNWATCWRRLRKTSSAWASRGRPSPTSLAATACCSTRTRCAAAGRSGAPIRSLPRRC
jgi:hypothetical protein